MKIRIMNDNGNILVTKDTPEGTSTTIYRDLKNGESISIDVEATINTSVSSGGNIKQQFHGDKSCNVKDIPGEMIPLENAKNLHAGDWLWLHSVNLQSKYLVEIISIGSNTVVFHNNDGKTFVFSFAGYGEVWYLENLC